MAEDTPVLRLEKVCKSYNVGTPVEVEVLHDIDLSSSAGEFVALIGPSGSGKSTLLNIIGLLDRPTKGRLFIEGQETSTLDDAAITKLRGHSIGFVFQYHYLISAFTALENVMMPLLVEHAFPNDEMREARRDLLGAGRPDAMGEQPRQQHVGRPAAARRDRARARHEPRPDPRRRADRKSRYEIRQHGFRDDASTSTRRTERRS